MNRSLISLLGASALVLAGPAAAVAIAGAAGTVAQGKKTVAAAPALRNSGGELELITGTVTAVDLAKHTVTIGNLVVGVHKHRLKVIGADGLPHGNLSAVRSGARVRFALDPGTREDRRIVAIYIVEQP